MPMAWGLSFYKEDSMKKLLTTILAVVLCAFSVHATSCKEPEKDKINIKYYANPADIVKIFGQEETIGLIPEPAATNLTNKIKKQGGNVYRLDLQELYDAEEKAYPQAVLMVKKSVLGTNPDIVTTLTQKIEESVSWVKNNPATAVEAISARGVTTLSASTLTESVINACKIYPQGAEEAKTSVKNYVNNIVEIDSSMANPVADDFFYTQSNLTEDKSQYLFVMPDGAPAIATAKLMNDSDNLSTGKTVDYNVVVADMIRSHLVSGTADFILAPVNLASKFYKTFDANDHYVMVSVVTHGNFYILSTEEITLSDLCGKQIAVPMMGAVPDWTLQMVLKKHGLTFTVVE